MAQTFKPDNVTVLQSKNGDIPADATLLIQQSVIANSKVMQLGKIEPMEGLEKTFEVFVKGGGAYWVNETQKIPTAKSEFKRITMKAKKLAVILPVSNEYLNMKQSDFFEFMKDKIAEAFYKKFDEAVIVGHNNPFKQSIARSVADAGNNKEIPISYDSILGLEDALYENDIEPNAFISKVQNRTELRNAIQTVNGVSQSLYDRASNTIDGITTVDFKSEMLPKGALIAGDFDNLVYGIPQGMTFSVSDSAQLSTLSNADGSPVNLFEQDMQALRVTMYVACMIIKDEAFSALNLPKDNDVYGSMPGYDKTESTDVDAVNNSVSEGGKQGRKAVAPDTGDTDEKAKK